MSNLPLHSALAKEKARLIAQCDRDRIEFDDCLLKIEQQTSWSRLAILGMGVVAPRWKMLVPVLAFVAPRLVAWLPASPGFKKALGSVLDWGRRAVAFSEGLKIIPRLLPGR